MLPAADKSPTTLECVQQPGDVIWVPNDWWHETCGLDEYSIGIGGVTYKGCCNDLHGQGAGPGGCAARGEPNGYGIDDIPYCQENHCESL